jgi:glycosyltransferase involved in cell wall biosynthesis
MRIAVVFHKDPYAPPSGIDLVRLRAITGGLIRSGFEAEIVAPVEKAGVIEDIIPVQPVEALNDPERFDLVKTCYHFSIMLLDGYRGPVVSRIVRVVDGQWPERDEAFRKELLHCQELIAQRAQVVALNNPENRERWQKRYGWETPVVLVPTGCSATLPEPGKNPYTGHLKRILFLGSLAADHMVKMIKDAAVRLRNHAEIHLVGRNKALMYGSSQYDSTESGIVDHGERPIDQVWDYIRNADLGLALATGPLPFDNDVSKIFDYLRGGLPVLSEEPIINNNLILKTGLGKTFKYDDIDDLVSKARELLENPPLDKRNAAMKYMAQEHSWDRRVQTYVDLFHTMEHE